MMGRPRLDDFGLDMERMHSRKFTEEFNRKERGRLEKVRTGKRGGGAESPSHTE